MAQRDIRLAKDLASVMLALRFRMRRARKEDKAADAEENDRMSKAIVDALLREKGGGEEQKRGGGGSMSVGRRG